MKDNNFIILIDDLESGYGTCCRICHETELEKQSLEAPCACKGTVKFAHRDCIQRWCDEKGSNTCEICLQSYEPGYTFTLKKARLGLLQPMAIGNSLEAHGREEEPETEPEDHDCSDFADVCASFCRSLALTFAFLLLVRDLFVTCNDGVGDFPFPLFTVLVLRASGVVLPMYLVMKGLGCIVNGALRGNASALQRSPRRRWRNSNHRL